MVCLLYTSVVTILLSFVAFSLFALADTFGNYNHIKTCTNSIKDTNITYASVIKSLKIGSGMNAYWSDYGDVYKRQVLHIFLLIP